MYPTFRIGTTNPGIDPPVDPGIDPAGMSLQEPFRGIDDDMNSTAAWKLSRLWIATGVEWKVQKPKTTSCHF